MPRLPKKYKENFARAMLKVLSRKTVKDLEVFGVQEAGPYATGFIETRYGPVSFSIYDDWVAMKLLWHPGFVKGSCRWFKFDHWKVNFNSWAGQRKVIDRPSHGSNEWAFGSHVSKFFSGDGPNCSVPSLEELDEYKQIYAAKKVQMEADIEDRIRRSKSN